MSKYITKIKERKKLLDKDDYFFHFVAGDIAMAWDINSPQDSWEIFLHQFAIVIFNISKFILFSFPPPLLQKQLMALT